MNKIIGLLPAWGAEYFIEPQIEQALTICDEVIVSIGAHCENIKAFADRTEEYAKKYKDQVIFVEPRPSELINLGKANTMNSMLEKSKLKEAGNWIWLLDVDEFYTNKDIKQIKDFAFSSDCNFIQWDEKYFFIDMKHYGIGERGRLWKIGNKKEHFLYTNKWTGDRSNVGSLQGLVGSFHYSLLLNPYAKICFWRNEHSDPRNSWVQWMNEIYLQYDFNNEEFYRDKLQKLFGTRKPILHLKDDLELANDDMFFIWKDKHPEVIEKFGLPRIPDFRKLYK